MVNDDWTTMSTPACLLNQKKPVNVTLDSDNKITDYFTKPIPIPDTPLSAVDLTVTATAANTSSSSLQKPSQQLLSSTTLFDNDTLDDLLGPKTNLDDFLDEDTLNFLFSRTTPTATQTGTAEPTAGPTTDNSFYGRLMSMILEGITTGHIKKQTLENSENKYPVLMLSMKKM